MRFQFWKIEYQKWFKFLYVHFILIIKEIELIEFTQTDFIQFSLKNYSCTKTSSEQHNINFCG